MSADVTSSPSHVTRIARRRALPGHEHEYEELVREMFTLMKKHPGFLAAEMIPPDAPGGYYQVVVNFASEDHLAGWDTSRDRETILNLMRLHAEDAPAYRRLTGLESWFEGPVVPASMHPPRHRMAFVTWLGIWPTASFFIFFVAPVLNRLGLPFLVVTGINTVLITLVMTYVLMPRLTRLMRGFLNPQR